MTIKTEIKNACKNHNFVGIVCIDGHEHTVKAFGEICGTPFDDFDNELDNQLMYCEEIAKGFGIEILVADSFEEAVEEDIIEENGYIKWTKWLEMKSLVELFVEMNNEVYVVVENETANGNERVRGNEHTIHLEMNKHLEMKTLVEMNAEMKGD